MILKSEIEALLRNVQKNKAKAIKERKKAIKERNMFQWNLQRGKQLAFADIEERLKKLV